MLIYALVFGLAVLLSAAFTPLAARIGYRLGMVDQPGGRRRHRGVVPRSGGLALFAAFGITLLLTLIPAVAQAIGIDSLLPPRNDANEIRRLVALLAGSTFCVVGGFLDDRFRFSQIPQYAIQVTAGVIAMVGLIFIKHVNNPLGDELFFGAGGFPWWLVLPITIFWFVGMMNTVNFLDGLSGLVSGVTVIFCAILTAHMLFVVDPPQRSVALVPVALLGAALGFLPYNFFAGRIFMGSSGSYFLGFALAALGIMGGARLATVLLILGLPILDVAWLIVSRWRRGISPGVGGRDHFHFRLLDSGLQERTIVVGYWLFCALFGGLTLVLEGRIYKLVALIGLGGIGVALLTWATRRPLPAEIPAQQGGVHQGDQG